MGAVAEAGDGRVLASVVTTRDRFVVERETVNFSAQFAGQVEMIQRNVVPGLMTGSKLVRWSKRDVVVGTSDWRNSG